MPGDGLYEPLGQPGGSARTARHAGRRALIGLLGAAGVLLAGSAAWMERRPPPERTAAVAPITVPPPPAPVAPPAPPEPPPQRAAMTSPEAEGASGVTVVRPPGSAAPPGTFIPVPQPDSVALPPAPDPRLVERGRYGMLPRRGPDGARPAEVYARPPAAVPPGKPRLALFVGGMGLNAALTSAAATALPPAVTLGFAPYGNDLDAQVAQARAMGHEVVLQIPMESFNPPDGAAAMPHLLATGRPPRETLEELGWQMSRFVGYAGVTSFLGAKFTADPAAFTPVLKDIGARGLFYLDDGTAPRNIAASAGPALGVPVVKADVVIDALGDPEAIEASLRKLEKLAQSKGAAVGSTAGLPNAVDRVAAFTARLTADGVVLVPVSSIVDVGTPPTTPTRH